ncbi:RagB/SusD family nutrient uptake outer membrane protein [Fulvivirga maritima]|uniref:RagB/SusD family nutrient uptake outer membrane protein n=1 Tax=Fulvivirga maritima TaxID=2904247 RepID=UPI001F172696|nr:RagB/SusD family nutrient uptake outer membrane protein [Fulvivirga maritima]UII26166.1 RagB/SusD family nutrient uptake outer membrane protein [Fulvivirga maritima]
MKKDRKLYKLQRLVICFLLIVSGSCSDFLDEDPISDVADQTFWNNEEEANSGVAGCYSQLRKTLNSALAYYAYGDLPTDVFASDRDIVDYNYVQEVDWGLAVAATETNAIMYRLRNFQYFYATIRQANLCLARIPTIPEDNFADYDAAFNQFMGEAYFVRAFSYFYMARVWGDVPIINDNTVDVVDLNDYYRDDKERVIAKAIEDCQAALTHLSWEYLNAEDVAVRANAGAAWTLLANIYAWQGDYENCERAAEMVLSSGNYSYVDRNDYLDIFSGQSSESIFEIAQNADNEANAASAGGISNYLLRDDYLTTVTDATLWPFDTLTLRQTLFNDENDLRRTEGFWQFDDDYPVLLKYANIDYSTDTYALGFNNIVIFRLAGIALLQAEAQAAQQKYAQARQTLDYIRGLAGIEPSEAPDSELFEAIIDERGRELFMEGHRFYDLVRLAREKNIFKFGSSDSDKISEAEFQEGKYYWPVQPSIMEVNPLLVQTEYWRSEME